MMPGIQPFEGVSQGRSSIVEELGLSLGTVNRDGLAFRRLTLRHEIFLRAEHWKVDTRDPLYGILIVVVTLGMMWTE